MQTERFPNRLIGESSPYLLSHAHNPVDWNPWTPESLEKAKREDKPIFLSIGYAACHWCHVMEKESFENEQIAKLLNQYFVSIKVDREQRPDLDHIYMTFTQALTGSGGWPMSVFLTPDLKPFFAGTYFPPEDRYGRPGFASVIRQLGEAWASSKDQIVESSVEMFAQVKTALLDSSGSQAILLRGILDRGAAQLFNGVDSEYGGIGQAPKFPHPIELRFFLYHYKHSNDARYLHAAELALRNMARGGLYDQIGGGFARYSVDRVWLVPHFEKMLYDNALLVTTYADCWRMTRKEPYRTVVRETLDWMLTEMQLPEGGFASAIDADSDGEEGKYYVWTRQQFNDLLGADAELLSQYFNVTPDGNFEGSTILHRNERSDRLEQSTSDFATILSRGKKQLLEARSQRVHPLTDDKLLTSWNGLAIAALCDGFQITNDERYRKAAVACADFIATKLWNGRSLVHSWRDGRSSTGQFLEDYAFLTTGLLALAESDEEQSERWLSLAQAIADRACELFMSADGSLFLREDGQADLIVRPREEADSAIPAPGSLLVLALLKLERLTGEGRYLNLGERALRQLSGRIENYPSAMTSALFALDYWLGEKIEIVLVGDSAEKEGMRRMLFEQFIPFRVIASSVNGISDSPLFKGRAAKAGETTVYVCRNSVCRLPVSTALELAEYLNNF